MPIGMQNITVTSLKNLTDIGNVTNPIDFFINVNHIVYDGYLYFILLFVLGIILYFAAQGQKDQPLNNLMYASAGCTVVAFFLRAVNMTRDGVILGLLNDFQMWIFPLITIVLAAIIWGSRE